MGPSLGSHEGFGILVEDDRPILYHRNRRKTQPHKNDKIESAMAGRYATKKYNILYNSKGYDFSIYNELFIFKKLKYF